MLSVFVVQHSHSSAHDVEDVKLIGVYSSQAQAETAVTRLGRFPGFSVAPDGFTIDEYQIDQDHWIEGYRSLDSQLDTPRSMTTSAVA